MNASRIDNGPSYRLSTEELERFKRDGWIGPFTVYSEEEMKQSWKRERLNLMDRSRSIYRQNAASGSTDISNYDRHLDSSWLADHVCNPRIVDRISSILGPDVLCWRTEFFPKYPGDEGTDWHQADTFANVSGKPQIVWPAELKEFGGTITVWTAFTEASIERACLQFIPGTHQQMFYDESREIHYRPEDINKVEKGGVKRGFFGYDYRELQLDPDWKPDESKAVSIELKAGECVVFWSTLLHASHPHLGKTKEARIGYAARYVPTCVRVYPDTSSVFEYGGTIELEGYGAVLVSGNNTYSHNKIAQTTQRGHPFTRR
jgi:non-heme Fe2+,alpha-ketoglutarate-dependent halogenase